MRASRLSLVFYCIQFERDPRLVVAQIADMVGPDLQLPYERRELVALIDDELASGQPLVELSMSPFEQTEKMLRDFLLSLRRRLGVGT